MQTFLTIFATVWILAISAFAYQGPSAHFDTNKTEVLNEQEITEFAKSILGSVSSITIYCHTDSRGSIDYNRTLAERRCRSVINLFSALDLSASAYVVVGEVRPVVVEEGADRKGREGLNRRVEIFYELITQGGEFKRHRVRGLVGYAPSGLKEAREVAPNSWLVQEDWDAEFGVGYSYRITRSLNIGVDVYTNKSIFGAVGFDF
jgi:hypothetical protein